MTWMRDMKALTIGLACVCAVRLPDLGPRNPPKRYLETIGDMAHCCCRWRSCVRSLFSSIWFFNLLFYNQYFLILRSDDAVR